MNSKQAKEIPLTGFIQSLGYAPTSIRGSDIWFRSPFRPGERTPSFKVDSKRNIWYDFGLGEGGTIIDFVSRHNNLRDISGVLSFIAESHSAITPGPAISLAYPTKPDEGPKSKPIIERVGEIADPALEAYLTERAIPIDLARLYFKEIEYVVEGRPYKALAFQNDSAGYEVRSPGWKGALGSKDLTTFSVPGRTDYAVFEGSFDFVSTLAHYGTDVPKSNVLVLNSVSLLSRAREHLASMEATKIYAYLDRDHAGIEALEGLTSAAEWKVRDNSAFYEGFKDPNEFLQATRFGRKPPSRER